MFGSDFSIGDLFMIVAVKVAMAATVLMLIAGADLSVGSEAETAVQRVSSESVLTCGSDSQCEAGLRYRNGFGPLYAVNADEVTAAEWFAFIDAGYAGAMNDDTEYRLYVPVGTVVQFDGTAATVTYDGVARCEDGDNPCTGAEFLTVHYVDDASVVKA